MVKVVADDGYDDSVVFGQSLADRRWLTTVRPDVKHGLLYSDDGYRTNCVYPEDELPVRVPGRVIICQAGGEMRRDTLDTYVAEQ